MLERVVRLHIILLLFLTVLFFGGVHVWSTCVLELTVCGLVALMLLRTAYHTRLRNAALLDFISQTGAAGIFLGLFCGYTLLQFLPLPQVWVALLSPTAAAIQRSADLINPGAVDAEPSMTLSLLPFESKIFFLKLSAYLGFFFLVCAAFPTRHDHFALIKSLIVFGAACSLYGLIETFSGHWHILWWPSFRHDLRVSGTFINPNHFAFYLGLIIPMGCGFLYARTEDHKPATASRKQASWYRRMLQSLNERESRTQKNGLLMFLIGLMILALFFTASRGAIFALSVSLMLMAGLALSKRQRRGFLLLLFFCLFIAGTYALQMGVEPVLERFLRIDWYHPSQELRLLYYRSAAPLISDFTLTGTGMGTFEEVYPLVKPATLYPTQLKYLHNDWLQVIVEGGLLGGSLVLSGYVFLILGCLRRLRNTTSRSSIGLGLGGIGTLVFAGLHSFVEFSLQMPGNALTLLALTAVSRRALQQVPGEM